MEKFVRSEDEVLFEARVRDMLRLCELKNSPRFSAFLDERLKQLAVAITDRESHVDRRYFGGYGEAERLVLGVFPGSLEPLDSRFPIVPITVTHRPKDKLSHRDFLGALMGLSIKREAVGDILIDDGLCVVFVLSTVAPVILQELDKVGRVGVRCLMGAPEELPMGKRFLELEGTVSSLRLDCVVSLLSNLSREKSAGLIKSGLVQVNSVEVNSASVKLSQGDKLSIRGYGKFILENVGGTTKKGRIHLTCLKYN